MTRKQTDRSEWLDALLRVRVPPEIAAGASGVSIETAYKHWKKLRAAGVLADADKAAWRRTRDLVRAMRLSKEESEAEQVFA